MYRIAKDNLNALYAAIAASKELYLPVKSAGKTNFAAWTEGATVADGGTGGCGWRAERRA